MLIEKAFAKVKGNYLNLASGYLSNSVRALTGAPVANYLTNSTSNTLMWNLISSAKLNNYLVTVGTDGENDGQVNSCGVTMRHALTVLAAFQLKNTTTNAVITNLYMIRNPRAYTQYSKAWSNNDPNWTADMKAQVPFGIDPTTSNMQGIFFVPYDIFSTCF